MCDLSADVCRVCQWSRLDFALWQEVVGGACVFLTLSSSILARQHQQCSCGKTSLTEVFLKGVSVMLRELLWFAFAVGPPGRGRGEDCSASTHDVPSGGL